MQKIMSKEPVIIPDGNGGIRERFLVEVPAMENDKTGEIFLGDDALEILDREKEEAFRVTFGAGETPRVDSSSCRELSMA